MGSTFTGIHNGMTAEEALALIDALLGGRRLKDIQTLVFRHSWNGWTYPQIAEHAGYDTGHIRDIGSELWQLLSQAFGEEVNKKNIQSVVRRRARPTAPAVGYRLPAQPNAFVGRERELAHCVGLLAPSGTVRLLTLSGPGGVGKTRLALAVATRLAEHFADGAAFVSLAAVREATLVPSAIATALGVREQAGRPLTASLMEFLRDRRLLLVLDNCEQVLATAPLVGELLAGADGLKVIATSRSVLKLYGEHEYPVPPFDLPDPQLADDPEAIGSYTAVRLFVERARAVRPDFALSATNARAVAEICRCADGLPLAIELAAARSKLLAPQALLSRLDHRLGILTGGPADLPERQRTLRSTIDWSYALLDERERRLFRRLAAFVGGSSLEAAERVCVLPGESGEEAFEVLASLADKSMVRLLEKPDGTGRFLMLETLREYALERLTASGEAPLVRRAHAHYFLEFAERTAVELLGDQQPLWLARLETEHANLRAALDHLLDDGESGMALRLAVALQRFWKVRGHFGEGRRWLGATLAACDQSTTLRAQALCNAGDLARCQGDYATARALCAAGLALHRTLGDPRGIAEALNSLATLAWSEGDCATARPLYEESLALQRRLKDLRGVSLALSNLGTVAWSEGDYAAARDHYTESLALDRHAKDKKGIANRLGNLGLIARELGEYEESLRLYRESLVLFSELGDREGVAIDLEEMAGVYGSLGRLTVAVELLGAAEALRQAIGAPLRPSEQADREATVARLRSGLDAQCFADTWQRGGGLSLAAAVERALNGEASRPPENG